MRRRVVAVVVCVSLAVLVAAAMAQVMPSGRVRGPERYDGRPRKLLSQTAADAVGTGAGTGKL